MLTYQQPPTGSRVYRFVARVVGNGLPPVEKTLRVRWVLSSAEHEITAQSFVVVYVGDGRSFEEEVELCHEPPADAPRPYYFEIESYLVSLEDRSSRLGGTHYRAGGTFDPRRDELVLPQIVLRGV